jgi:type IV pilus assembly protein PilN
MIRTNLSTRPFYNERAVHAIAAILAVALLAVTAWQATRVVRLSRYKTELNAAIKRHRTEAEDSTAQAQNIRQGLDQKQLAALAGAAKEANDLIAKRTFSWTELFNQLEATLPGDVMLMGVHPEIADGVTQLHMDLQGKGEEVITAFWDRLEKTGAFRDPEWSTVNVTDDGLHRMAMNVVYLARVPAARPVSVPAVNPPAERPAASAGKKQ